MKVTILFISTLIILACFNIAIYQKEAILQEGEPILLQLTPQDPRALMQGDYLKLRYVIEDEMRKADPKELEKNTLAVIKVDSNNVAHFEHLYKGDLKEGEKLIKYHYKPLDPNPIHIRPDSYMFQEGLQPLYEKAKYAIFHYKGSKEYLLIGVADNDRNEINASSNE